MDEKNLKPPSLGSLKTLDPGNSRYVFPRPSWAGDNEKDHLFSLWGAEGARIIVVGGAGGRHRRSDGTIYFVIVTLRGLKHVLVVVVVVVVGGGSCFLSSSRDCEYLSFERSSS